MKNRLFLVAISWTIFSLPLFSQTTTYKSISEDGITLISYLTPLEGLVITLKNDENSKIDTIVKIIPHVLPKAIKHVWFDSSICGFVLETNSLVQYFLYSKDESGWRKLASEVILMMEAPQKVGFGGVKLLDGFTLLIYDNHADGIKSRIHLYDSKGNRRVLKEVEYNETKYKY
jgi:hypothetical protein